MTPLARLHGLLAGAARARPPDDGKAAERLRELTAELARCRAEEATAVAARRAAEEAVTHSADKLRSMVSALPVGVVTIDRAGRVELWNRAAETMLGYPAEDMIGWPMPQEVFSPLPESGVAVADLFLSLVTGGLIKGEEVLCRRHDGSTVEASFSGVALMDEDGRASSTICVFEDVTQRKLVARQLHQAQKMEAVGQLTGGLAHDVNNILGVAIGNLDLLEEEIPDRPDLRPFIEAARDALLRGAELTRALLAFSRRQPLRPVRVDAAELLSSVIRMLGRVLGEQVRVRLLQDGDLWPVAVDAAQLEAAVTNLAINARDAMPHGGQLTVAARNAVLDADPAQQDGGGAAGDYLLIEISDTGCGMSAETLTRAFEPFFTTKPVGRGTGLGLSMVYGFIKQSGGQIKIYSEVGLGTTVRLYLPRADRAAAADAAAPSAAPMPGGDETVLVVEDNADVRRTVERQLTGLGYRVLAAGHGPAALALLETGQRVDLLFTDVVMPEGMNGFELATAARRLRPGLKVLLTSGFPGSTLTLPAALPAATGLLGKPYRRQDLARMVRAALDGGDMN